MDSRHKEKTSENVRAVNRALDILLAFTREDFELSASDLAQRVGLTRPTLYRLLYTLESKGFIASVGEPQRFRLGPSVAKMTLVWTETLDLEEIAEPVMRQLWAETGETVALLVPEGALRFTVAEMPSPQPLSFRRGVGSSEHIARGASGRAILAFLEGVDHHLSEYTDGLAINLVKLRAELEATRRSGYAVSRNEMIEGAVAVAAPFYGRKGVAGSLGIFGPAVRMNEQTIAKLGRRVMQEAAKLSSLLGVEAKPRRRGAFANPQPSAAPSTGSRKRTAVA